MKLHYYPQTGSLCIKSKPTAGTETRELVGGLNVDLDAAGEVVGFDITTTATTVEVAHLPQGELD